MGVDGEAMNSACMGACRVSTLENATERKCCEVCQTPRPVDDEVMNSASASPVSAGDPRTCSEPHALMAMTMQDVCEFFKAHGLGMYVSAVEREHVDGSVLRDLNDEGC